MEYFYNFEYIKQYYLNSEEIFKNNSDLGVFAKEFELFHDNMDCEELTPVMLWNYRFVMAIEYTREEHEDNINNLLLHLGDLLLEYVTEDLNGEGFDMYWRLRRDFEDSTLEFFESDGLMALFILTFNHDLIDIDPLGCELMMFIEDLRRDTFSVMEDRHLSDNEIILRDAIRADVVQRLRNNNLF